MFALQVGVKLVTDIAGRLVWRQITSSCSSINGSNIISIIGGDGGGEQCGRFYAARHQLAAKLHRSRLSVVPAVALHIFILREDI